MAALGSQSIASSYEQLLHVDRDGGGNGTTHVSVKDGDNGTTFGFTIATDALMMSSTNRLEFGDTGTYIHQSADGVLDLVSDTEIEINATTIDMNGAADLSGNLTVGGDIDLEGSIDVNGTSNLDAVDIDGAVQIDSTVTVGADDQGYDVIFYGDTASSNMTWDTSADDLILNDSRLFIDQDDNATALYVDSESTTADIVSINGDATTDGTCFRIDADGLEDGNIALFESDSNDSSSRKLVQIINNNTAATGTTALHIQQDAACQGMVIDQNGNNQALKIDTEATTNHGLYFDTPATTSGYIINVADANSLTTGSMARLYSNSSTNDGRNLLNIINDNASATGAKCVNIQQDAANAALRLEVNAAGDGIYIDHNADKQAIKIDSESTAEASFQVESDALTTGACAYLYSNSSDNTSRQLLNIKNDNTSGSGARTIRTTQDAAQDSVAFDVTNSSYNANVVFINATTMSSSSNFKFIECYTGGDSDTQHNLRGDGVTQNRSGTFEAGDYAEYFESKDGKVIAVGTTVKLDGDKIVACEDGDIPLGVVRPLSCSVIGNSAWANWGSKYLTDDYGSPVMEEYTVTEWIEDTDKIKTEAVEAKDAVLYEEGDEIPDGKKVGDVKEEAVEGEAAIYWTEDFAYQTDKIPSDVTVPDDATVKSKGEDGSKLMRRKQNPDYDESKTYIPREERDEWHIVGLLGQIQVTKGQPLADNWIKMKDVSDTVEMYFVK